MNMLFTMNNQKNTNQLREFLVEKILKTLNGKISIDHIIELATTLKHKPEMQHDIPLVQSAAVLDFLAKQIAKGNRDVISQEIIQESYVYILDKLM